MFSPLKSINRYARILLHRLRAEPPPGGGLEGAGKKHLLGKKFPRGKRMRLPPGGSCHEVTEGECVPKGRHFQTGLYVQTDHFAIAYCFYWF